MNIDVEDFGRFFYKRLGRWPTREEIAEADEAVRRKRLAALAKEFLAGRNGEPRPLARVAKAERPKVVVKADGPRVIEVPAPKIHIDVYVPKPDPVVVNVPEQPPPQVTVEPIINVPPQPIQVVEAPKKPTRKRRRVEFSEDGQSATITDE
jgi:hypothetical protein